MTPHPEGPAADDRRLDDLLVRRWDGSLSDAEAEELDRLLAAHPGADERVEAFCLQAVVAAERAGGPRPEPVPPRPGRWRGRVLGLAAAAAVVAAVVLIPWGPGPAPAGGGVVLLRSSGEVRVGTAVAEQPAGTGVRVGAGETVRTVGDGASATLGYPDGTAVVLTGDTAATVAPDGAARTLVIGQGAVSAEVAAGPAADRLTLATAEARAVAGGGARLAVSRAAARTEVGVTEGRVRVTNPGGDTLLDMGGGDTATVAADGTARKGNLSPAPEEYAWDPAGPLPPGWPLGRIAPDPFNPPAGWSFAPDVWDDPHIRRTCWQIRSPKRWVAGLFQFRPDSRFRVRYRVDRPGTGQLLVVVRPDPPHRTGHTVLLAPVPFEPAPDGGWRTVELAAADWVPERFRPDCPRPWVAFEVVFNTYESDLGLRVAEFAVAPGRPPPGPR